MANSADEQMQRRLAKIFNPDHTLDSSRDLTAMVPLVGAIDLPISNRVLGIYSGISTTRIGQIRKDETILKSLSVGVGLRLAAAYKLLSGSDGSYRMSDEQAPEYKLTNRITSSDIQHKVALTDNPQSLTEAILGASLVVDNDEPSYTTLINGGIVKVYVDDATAFAPTSVAKSGVHTPRKLSLVFGKTHDNFVTVQPYFSSKTFDNPIALFDDIYD